MAIENRNPEPGTKLIASYKKEEDRAEVVAGEDGKILYRLDDGREFKSPSSAATASPARPPTAGKSGVSKPTAPQPSHWGQRGRRARAQKQPVRRSNRLPLGFGGSPTRRVSGKET